MTLDFMYEGLAANVLVPFEQQTYQEGPDSRHRSRSNEEKTMFMLR